MSDTTTANVPEGFHLEEWVCTGKVQLVTGGLGIKFVRPDGEPFVAKPKRAVASRLVRGAVYEIPVSDDGQSAVFGRARWLRLHPNEDERLSWQVEEQALEVKLEAERMLDKLKKRNEIGELLVPIRQVYAKGDRWTRCAIEALVLQALRNPL